MVSNVCGFSFWPGMLKTLVPMSTVALPGAPGAVSTVNAKKALAATLGFELVANGARQLQHGPSLGARPQKALVGNAFLIESEYMGLRWPRRRAWLMDGSSDARVVRPAAGKSAWFWVPVLVQLVQAESLGIAPDRRAFMAASEVAWVRNR